MDVRVTRGWVEIMVHGHSGEVGSYSVPMAPLSPSRGSRGLVVVNFTSATIGLLHEIATVGNSQAKLLSTYPICRGTPNLSLPASPVRDSGLALPPIPAAALYGPSQIPAEPTGLSQVLGPAGGSASSTAGPAGASSVLSSIASSDLAPNPARNFLVPALLDPVPSMLAPSAVVPASGPRQSPRRVAAEESCFLSMLDKAASLKKHKLEGGSCSATSHPAALPSEILELVAPNVGHFNLSDLKLMGSACGVSAEELSSLDDIDPVSSLSEEDVLGAVELPHVRLLLIVLAI